MAKAWEAGKDDSSPRGYPWSSKTVFQQSREYVQVDVSPIRPLPSERIGGEVDDDPALERTDDQRRIVSSLIRHFFRGQQLFIPSARPPPASLVGNMEWATRGSTHRQYELARADLEADEGDADFVDVEDNWEVLRRRREERARANGPIERSTRRVPPRRGRSHTAQLETSDTQSDQVTRVESISACAACRSANPSRRRDTLSTGTAFEHWPIDNSLKVAGTKQDCLDSTGDKAEGSYGEPIRLSGAVNSPMVVHAAGEDGLDGLFPEGDKVNATNVEALIANDWIDLEDVDRLVVPPAYTTVSTNADGTPFLYRKATKNAFPETIGHTSCPATIVNDKPTRQRRRVTFSSQNTADPLTATKQGVPVVLPRLDWSVGHQSSFAKDLNLALNQEERPQTPTHRMPLVETRINSVLTPVDASSVSLKAALISEMRRSGAIISRMSPTPPEDAKDRRASSCPEVGDDSMYDIEGEHPVAESQPWPGTQMLLAQAHQNLFDSPVKGLHSVTPAAQIQSKDPRHDRTPLEAIEHNQQSQTQSADVQWSPWSTIKKPSRPTPAFGAMSGTPIDTLKRTNTRTKSLLYQSVSASTGSSPSTPQTLNKQNISSSPKQPTVNGSGLPDSSTRISPNAQGQGQAQSQSQVVSASFLLSREDSWDLDHTIGEVSEYLFGSTRDIEPVLAIRSSGCE